MKLIDIAKAFFTKRKVKEEIDEYCYVARDSNTNLDNIFYSRGNKTFTVDLNSIITMHWIVRGKPCSSMLEPEDADIVKKAIVQYYDRNNTPLPENFQFLKVYSEKHKSRKPLFG